MCLGQENVMGRVDSLGQSFVKALRQAKEKSWPQTAWGVLSLGLVR